MAFTDQLRTATAGHRGKLAAILVVLALVILLVVYFRPGSRAGSYSMATDPITAQAQVLDSVERQRAAVAETSVRAARDDGQQVLRMIDHVSQLRSAWDRDVAAVLQNHEGRLIAADADRLARFATLLHLSFPETDALAQQRERIRRLLAPAEDAIAGKIAAFKPDDAYQQQLDRERSLAQRQEQELADAQKMLAALIAEAKQKNSAPADLPLQVKVEQLERETAAARLRAIQEARAQAEEQNTTQLADLEKRKLAEIGEAERKHREAELDAQRTEQETQARLTQEKTAHDKLVTLANNPEVQARYQVFLAKGRYLFDKKLSDGERKYGDPKYGDIPAPASLRRLREVGVLDNEFVFWATGTADDDYANSPAKKYGYKWQGKGNDRPVTWKGFPTTEEEQALVKQRYDEFRELAPIWVEMGLLKP